MTEELHFAIEHRPLCKSRARASESKFPFSTIVKIIERAWKNKWGPVAVATELQQLFSDRKLTVRSADGQKDYEKVVQDAFYNALIHHSGMIDSVPYGQAVSVTMWFQFDDDRDATDLSEDVDNLIKMVLDSLNGVAWTDDKKAVHKEGGKMSRCVQSRTEVVIAFLGDV